MNIKIDNMVDLRAFCLEMAINGHEYPHKSFIDIAREYEEYILGGISLPDQPFNTDQLLYDTMTDIIKNKEENAVKTRLY